ncbi:Arm DNA-binding domain-containing protein [Vibrio lentus]|nr:Arm DNA-binding domain-containing protein [Vibrio lentus]
MAFLLLSSHFTKALNLALGKYPDVSLAKARTKAIEARELLADGIDPKSTVTDSQKNS